MPIEPDLSVVSALIGDQARALMLSALMSGEPLPAGELAARAHISASTASAHLAKLVDGGLLVVEQRGKYRYFRLKNNLVAQALEALARIATPPVQRNAAQSNGYQALCTARTCYDHLAGKLGVAVTQALVQREVLAEADGTFLLTPAGETWLREWDIDVAVLRTQRRQFVRACLDWSERRDHVAGAVGAALCTYFLAKRWVVRSQGSRALVITRGGYMGLRQALGITDTCIRNEST
jgi:DNA-binding transcriptional ArsR family regulator